MNASPETDLIVVSDLHMSLGTDPASGAVDRHEHFRADDAFAHFLDDVVERAVREGRTWRLVVLGDLLDFLHACRASSGKGALRPDTSEPASIAKLEAIARGHPLVFQALGRFAAAGHAISVVPGNHDMELIRTSAQRRFCELVSAASGHADAGVRISFHPWIFYVPGLVYAEHGSQYHDINSFRTLLAPYRSDDPGRLELPLGSALSLYLIELLGSLTPGRDRIEPTLAHALEEMRKRPYAALRALPLHAKFLKLSLRFMAAREWGQNGARSRYQERVLGPYAAELGLRPELLASIDELSVVSPPAIAVRLLRAGLAGSRRNRQRIGARNGTAPDYLQRAAAAVHGLLERAGEAVPYYVFGHAHRPEEAAVRSGRSPALYLNSGTWSLLVPTRAGDLGSPARQTFVEIRRDTNGPVARLLWWNDAEGRCEPAPRPQVPAPLVASA